MSTRRQFLKTAAAMAGGLWMTQQASAQITNGVFCPTLMYHYVSYPPDDADRVLRDLIVTPEDFSTHLDRLLELGFTAITMKQLWAHLIGETDPETFPEKPVILTFDDGYIDAYQHAFPRLLERGMVGTFFIVKNFMEQPGYLSWGMAGEMKNAGMEIGNHSVSHPNLSSLGYDAQRAEIEDAANTITEVLGEHPRFFCYPLGRFNATTRQILRETGHHAAVTTSDGTLKWYADPYRMSRIRIRNTTTPAQLEWAVNRRI